MKTYRIKHLPTGLYYHPSSEVQIKIGAKTHRTKTNLGKKGKIYPMLPTLKWISNSYYNHVQRVSDKMLELLESSTGDVSFDYRDGWKTYPFVESEWLIEEC
jgi:hypothetical protein